MVLPGQFLERAVVVRGEGGLMLDALYHRGRRGPACVVAAPHPALGGSMTVPAINEVAWALTRAGHPTLRFDYRGVGGSQGRSRHRVHDGLESGALPAITPESVRDEVADLLAAAHQLAASVMLAPQEAPSAGASGAPIGLDPDGGGAEGLCAVGYSFGACVALAARRERRWEKLVLIAPPSEAADLSALAEVEVPLLIVCAQHDPLCDRALLGRLVEPLGERARIEVIPHADHAFRRGSSLLGRTVAEWLRAGRPPWRPELQADDDEAPEVIELELPDDGEPPLELDE